jgi:hypothetical protein
VTDINSDKREGSDYGVNTNTSNDSTKDSQSPLTHRGGTEVQSGPSKGGK